ARAVDEAGLDPNECYRLRDLNFSADRAKFFFADGYLILGRAINGRRITALFSTDVEGGDGELLLLPPNRAERQSIAAFTGSPTLDEHFSAAFLMFSPEVLAQFTEQIQSNPSAKKSPEMGALLDSKFSSVARNIAGSFDVRLTWSLLAPESNRGFFAALISGRKLGNFDMVYDPHSPEQIAVGTTTNRDNRSYFETWASFAVSGDTVTPLPQFTVSDYQIQATVNPDLSLKAVTRYRLRVDTASPAVPLEISSLMNITEARIDGARVEVLQRDDLRSDLIRNSGTELALALASAPLAPGRDHEIEIHHEGRVILDAGNQVYYIASRANWYPGYGNFYTTYDLTFRVPKNLQIVLPGMPTGESVEGEERVVRHKIETPVRYAGFNLGIYDKTSVTHSGFTVDVYANHEFERALQPRQMVVMPSPVPQPGRRIRVPTLDQTTVAPMPTPNPTSRLQSLASAIAGAMDYFTSLFGPPPLRRLEVTPLPGNFGQGFPGLIYISTASYLSPTRPVTSSAEQQYRIFFEELLQPHEAAHQWWGNLVYTAGYHDEWITEGLANYSALLYLDKQHGNRKVSDAVLNSYRDQLIAGDTDATGPIVQGRRLLTSQKPDAWRVITYGKGTWILHMLRARMGDETFLKMIAALRREFERKEISTEQFRLHCAKFLPAGSPDNKLEAFFDQWVYGTGIPQLKMSWSVKPGKVTGSIIQTGVGEDFNVDVPVEVHLGAKVIRKWVHTDNEGAQFSIPIAAAGNARAGIKVTLDPDNTVLRRP
ncbi:MAG TPA: M1 family aminopeptidase, partial [Bryobacteraceae bacterium]